MQSHQTVFLMVFCGAEFLEPFPASLSSLIIVLSRGVCAKSFNFLCFINVTMVQCPFCFFCNNLLLTLSFP